MGDNTKSSVLAKLKEWYSTRKMCWRIFEAFVFSVIICLVALFVIIGLLGKDFMGSACCNVSDATEEINAWFYFLSGAGTAALAIIAYWQIGDINKQNRTDFLLRIDERWGSPEAIKARIVIHKVYRRVIHKQENRYLKPLNKKWNAAEAVKAENFINTLYMKAQKKFEGIKFEKENGKEFTKDDFIQAIIGIEIIKMSADTALAGNFIHLLNFLDFMETIGYLANTKKVTTDELEALCGESLIFNYKIFEPYIEHKREKHKREKDQKKEFYAYFKYLHEELKKNPDPKANISLKK